MTRALTMNGSRQVARGSLAELETFIELCARLAYLSPENSANLSNGCAEINKMLTALMQSLKARH
ncbi:MAG: four helix bundle protein [Pseudomonadales bacterium]|nr:four helix bundle protein [Pseudomonadales bacterium]